VEITIRADQLVAGPAIKVARQEMRRKKPVNRTRRTRSPGAPATRVEKKAPGRNREAPKEVLDCKCCCCEKTNNEAKLKERKHRDLIEIATINSVFWLSAFSAVVGETPTMENIFEKLSVFVPHGNSWKSCSYSFSYQVALVCNFIA